MASNYPGSLDSFDTIASDKKTSDSVGGRTHRQMHNDLGDALEAVQAELGTDPAGTFATVKARLAAYDAYAAKTSAYTATVDDNTLNVTSGTFTLDLPAASTCTGKTLRVKNSGTGVVTLDGNSSETVEGVATFPLGPGSYIEITSTGSVWILTGGVPDTGWRELSASLLNSWSATWLRIRRQGNRVALSVNSLGGVGTWANVADVPSGFAPLATCFGIFRERAISGGSVRFAVGTSYIGLTDTAMIGATWNSSSYSAIGEMSWVTSATWPTSLPGTAA